MVSKHDDGCVGCPDPPPKIWSILSVGNSESDCRYLHVKSVKSVWTPATAMRTRVALIPAGSNIGCRSRSCEALANFIEYSITGTGRPLIRATSTKLKLDSYNKLLYINSLLLYYPCSRSFGQRCLKNRLKIIIRSINKSRSGGLNSGKFWWIFNFYVIMK